MAFGPYTLSRIQSLQPAIQPLATRLVDLAAEQGIAIEVVQGYRSPAEQQALFTSGAGVTKAPALSSYHNYGLAFDVVPTAYKDVKDWNPNGPLWAQIGRIGESVGLTWGGRWRDKDLPHFQLSGAPPIQELKSYYEKAIAAGKSVAQAIMPISIEPTTGALGIMALLGAAWLYWFQPRLARRKLL